MSPDVEHFAITSTQVVAFSEPMRTGGSLRQFTVATWRNQIHFAAY